MDGIYFENVAVYTIQKGLRLYKRNKLVTSVLLISTFNKGYYNITIRYPVDALQYKYHVILLM